MRNPDRIPQVLAKIRAAWNKNPDLRLGQIVSNLTPHRQDVFYVEDDVLVKDLPEVPLAPGVTQCAHRLQKKLDSTHPDDLGDGLRAAILDLLRALREEHPS